MIERSHPGFFVNYTLRHSGYSSDVYWSDDVDEAMEYAQFLAERFWRTHLIVVWNNADQGHNVGMVVDP